MVRHSLTWTWWRTVSCQVQVAFCRTIFHRPTASFTSRARHAIVNGENVTWCLIAIKAPSLIRQFAVMQQPFPLCPTSAIKQDDWLVYAKKKPQDRKHQGSDDGKRILMMMITNWRNQNILFRNRDLCNLIQLIQTRWSTIIDDETEIHQNTFETSERLQR